ncbi:hypothetical protein, partial [Microbacterium lacticum]|uniref:hypothetical protein n=1 Tax=Microbacterium lacticum TaxID=33885 RepID=UPI001E309405
PLSPRSQPHGEVQLGGRIAERGLTRAVTVTLTGTEFALLICGSTGGAVAGFALVEITYFSAFPPLDTRIMG